MVRKFLGEQLELIMLVNIKRKRKKMKRLSSGSGRSVAFAVLSRGVSATVEQGVNSRMMNE